MCKRHSDCSKTSSCYVKSICKYVIAERPNWVQLKQCELTQAIIWRHLVTIILCQQFSLQNLRITVLFAIFFFSDVLSENFPPMLYRRGGPTAFISIFDAIMLFASVVQYFNDVTSSYFRNNGTYPKTMMCKTSTRVYDETLSDFIHKFG